MSTTLTPTEELTHKRKQVLKVIAADFENEELARSQLNAHMYYDDMGEFIEEEDDEEEDTLQTTTSLLNKIVEEDGYLIKTEQGGTNRFVLDTEADEDEDNNVTGVTPNEIAKLVSQIENRHDVRVGISEDRLSDWGHVCSEVNDAVGHRVLRVVSNPNRYRLTKKGLKLIEKELL